MIFFKNRPIDFYITSTRVIRQIKWIKSSKNGVLRNSSINCIFLWRLPIQKHPKSFITEINIWPEISPPEPLQDVYHWEKTNSTWNRLDFEHVKPCRKHWNNNCLETCMYIYLSELKKNSATFLKSYENVLTKNVVFMGQNLKP